MGDRMLRFSAVWISFVAAAVVYGVRTEELGLEVRGISLVRADCSSTLYDTLAKKQINLCKRIRWLYARCISGAEQEIPGAFIPLIPIISSKREAYGRVSESSFREDRTMGWRAFDDNPTSTWTSSTWPVGSEWVAYDFGKETKVNKLEIMTDQPFPERVPRNFKLQGSSDGRSWKTLLSVFGYSERKKKTEWIVPRAAKYSMYRLYVTRDNYGDTGNHVPVFVSVQKMQLYQREVRSGGSPPACDIDAAEARQDNQRVLCEKIAPLTEICKALS